MKGSHLSAAAAAVLLAVVSVACGDSDDRLSASEYRSQGNKICGEVGVAVQAAVPDAQPSAEAVQKDHAPALEAALSPLRERLGELRPPASLATEHAQLLSAVDTAIATLGEAARDEAVAARLREEGPPLDELGDRARDLGLTRCAG